MWLQWMWDGFISGIMKVIELWWLVLLFAAIQVVKDSGWLDWVSRKLRPLLSPLRLPDEAGVPVVAGLAVGMTYGAGVILQTAEEGKLNRNQLTVSCVFLGVCHAVFEETVLFSSAGTSGILLISIRFVSALVIGLIAARMLLPAAPAKADGPAERAAR